MLIGELGSDFVLARRSGKIVDIDCSVLVVQTVYLSLAGSLYCKVKPPGPGLLGADGKVCQLPTDPMGQSWTIGHGLAIVLTSYMELKGTALDLVPVVLDVQVVHTLISWLVLDGHGAGVVILDNTQAGTTVIIAR